MNEKGLYFFFCMFSKNYPDTWNDANRKLPRRLEKGKEEKEKRDGIRTSSRSLLIFTAYNRICILNICAQSAMHGTCNQPCLQLRGPRASMAPCTRGNNKVYTLAYKSTKFILFGNSKERKAQTLYPLAIKLSIFYNQNQGIYVRAGLPDFF